MSKRDVRDKRILSTKTRYSVGAYVAGRISDKKVIEWRERRAGVWVPEDRLRVTLFGALCGVPLGLVLSGLITENIQGTPGIVLNLICVFVHGVGVSPSIHIHFRLTPRPR